MAVGGSTWAAGERTRGVGGWMSRVDGMDHGGPRFDGRGACVPQSRSMGSTWHDGARTVEVRSATMRVDAMDLGCRRADPAVPGDGRVPDDGVAGSAVAGDM